LIQVMTLSQGPQRPMVNVPTPSSPVCSEHCAIDLGRVIWHCVCWESNRAMFGIRSSHLTSVFPAQEGSESHLVDKRHGTWQCECGRRTRSAVDMTTNEERHSQLLRAKVTGNVPNYRDNIAISVGRRRPRLLSEHEPRTSLTSGGESQTSSRTYLSWQW
jgi:hypothetical protein